MRNCSECGKEFDIGMFSLISDMCDDCYEKVHYYTPDFNYKKEYITRDFTLFNGQYSMVDLLIFFSDCEREVYNEIKKIHSDNNRHFITVFREFEIVDKMKELINTHHIELEFSFFFGDNKYETVPCFEDRKKYRSVIIR